MGATRPEIQALLREIEDDDGTEGYNEPHGRAPLPFTQPTFHPAGDSRHHEPASYGNHAQRQTQHQKPLYESQRTQAFGHPTFHQRYCSLEGYGTCFVPPGKEFSTKVVGRPLLAGRSSSGLDQLITTNGAGYPQPSGPNTHSHIGQLNIGLDESIAADILQLGHPCILGRPWVSGLHHGIYHTRLIYQAQSMIQTPPNRILQPNSSPPTFPSSSPSLQVCQRRKAPVPHQGYRTAGRQKGLSSLTRSTQNQPGAQTRQLSLEHAPPIVQGIRLVAPNNLPDRFRSVFQFPLFNAVQSKCYGTVYNSSENLVVSAPTGSGKTVILELAVCRLLLSSKNGQYKIVYMAPTKSLCSERQRDWQAKFSSLGLSCAELTGDTDHAQLRHVQNASIIITTPEKWDSMTRKWKDHAKLMQLVKLFLCVDY